MLFNQWLIPPPPSRFELSEVLAYNGHLHPSNAQYVRLRNFLRRNGYVRYSIVGRKEYWIFEATMTEADKAAVKAHADTPGIWTTESYALHHFRLKPPFDALTEHRIERALLENGWVPRRRPGQVTYWSAKAQRRQPRPPAEVAFPIVPKRPSYPPGAFNRYEFMAYNNVPRKPENVQWALQHLQSHCITYQGKWVRPGPLGGAPATLTGVWVAPPIPAFTTYQFQVLNGVTRVTRDQWQSALDWLGNNGYRFNPTIKRWVQE